jgi:hypothetical protein
MPEPPRVPIFARSRGGVTRAKFRIAAKRLALAAHAPRIARIRQQIGDEMTLRSVGLGFVLAAATFAGAAEANVTANYGCRFYLDGKVYVEFRIEEIRHTQWAEQASFTRGNAKPVITDVEVEENPAQKDALKFLLPEQKAEIVVANTLDYVNAVYNGPTRKALPGECEQADSRNALNRWFIEREREKKKNPR